MKLENIGLGIDVENVERFKKYTQKDNADEKKSQDNNQTKYEKISLADLLNEDDF